MTRTKFLSFIMLSMILFSCQSRELEPIRATPVIEENTTASTAAVQTPTVAQGVTPNGPVLANCSLFPVNNIWNTRVDALPTHPMSDTWIDSIGREEGFHMDF